MDMRTPPWMLKKFGNEDILTLKNYPADRAYAVTVAYKAVDAAADMHEPVFAPVHRGERRGTDQLPGFKLRGTDRADLRVAGGTLALWLYPRLLLGTASQGGKTHLREKGRTNPQQAKPDKNIHQNFKKLFHNHPF